MSSPVSLSYIEAKVLG